MDDSAFSVFGVHIRNIAGRTAIAMLEAILDRHENRSAAVFFVNAHTLNLAAGDPMFRDVLNAADFVFPDGTGVRWAARLQGVRVIENLPGTDFVPDFFRATAHRGFSYFLLGADETTIAAAADYAQEQFPGWRCVGVHHGFLANPEVDAAAVEMINAARPDVLLVGMGNPLQERWIVGHQARLHVPLAFGIGGLFDFWAGNVRRAPGWLRRLGHEWFWRLLQDPRGKIHRYLLGNPLFLARILQERFSKRKQA